MASDKYSGAENVACTIIENMSSDFDMAYCSPKGEIEKTLKEKYIKYYGIDKFSYGYIRKVVKKYNPDIIHAHDFKASIICSLFKNKRVISQLHKNDPDMKKISIKSLTFNVVSSNFYKIVGVSQSILDEYIFKKNIEDKYFIIENYVDKEKIVKLANEFKVDKEYDLFYFGRLSDEKNPLEFIEIIKKLNNKNIKCVMIGDGPLMNECKKKIEDYNLSNNIDLVGFKSNPFPYIKCSKIGIMPSKFEGFGLTAIEAMLLGKPVLNSGVGGLKDIFMNHHYYICKSGEYINKIKSILNDDKKNTDLGNIYSEIESYKQKMLDLYE